MKLKDIKKQLKQESAEATPNVLEKVKVSPINRLLKNEKALVALKKTASTLTLLLVLAIVVILSVSIYALVTQKENLADQNYTFVSLWLYDTTDSDPSETFTIYSFVVNGDGEIIFAYDEKTDTILPSPAFLGNALSILSTDGFTGIKVMTTSDRPGFARQFFNDIYDAIQLDSRFDNMSVEYHVNDQMSRFMFGESLHTLKGYDSVKFNNAKTINELCSLYVEFAT